MNADTKFKQFVDRQQRPDSAAGAIDWNKEREDWLSHLEQLYKNITEYLDEYVKSGTIKLHESNIELNEENIGVYMA